MAQPDSAHTTPESKSLQLADGGAVPEGYVPAPGGYVHSSCLRVVPKGHRVDPLTRNLWKDGKVAQTYPECGYPRLGSKGQRVDVGAPVPAPTPGGPGSYLDTQMQPRAGRSITAVVGTMTVPNDPPNDHGQLVYYWNGIQPTNPMFSGPWVEQPVLQWGSSPLGGGPYWAYASWIVGPDGSAWTTGSLQPSFANDTIDFEVMDVGVEPNYGLEEWDITATGSTGSSDILQSYSLPNQIYKAIPAALEWYNVFTDCSDVPTAQMTGIQVFDGTTNPVTFNFLPYNPINAQTNINGTPACFFGLQTNGNATFLWF